MLTGGGEGTTLVRTGKQFPGWIRQQPAAEGEFLFAKAVRQQAEGPDALETWRECVDEEAADEFIRRKRHRAGLAFLLTAIVPPLKGHLAVGYIEDAAVGESDPVRIPAQIIQHLLRSAERRLGIYDPIGSCKRCQIVVESGLIGERFEISEPLQLLLAERVGELLEKQTAEQAGKHTHRQKEAGAAGFPLQVGTDTAAGDDEVDMGVMQQVLSPGMEDAEEADFGPQEFRIACDRQQSLGSRLEENAVNHALVVKGDAGDLFRHGKDDMKIFDRQQFPLPTFQPLGPLCVLALGAMPVSARVIGDARKIALAALFGVPAEGGGAADFNGAHDAELPEGQFALGAIEPAVLPENVGQLKSRPEHNGQGRRLVRGFRGCSSRSRGLMVLPITLGDTCV